MKKLYFGTLLLFFVSVTGFAQDHASIATVSEHRVSRMSFSTLSNHPDNTHFVFSPEESGKLIVMNSEGERIEEQHFSKDKIIEIGHAWPKGHYQIKIIGRDRTDFTKVRKD